MSFRKYLVVLGFIVFFFLFTSYAVAQPYEIFADADGDGKVDGVDYAVWFNNYNQNTSNGVSDGDFDENGTVNISDFVAWINSYGKNPPPTPTSTQPTPTTPSTCGNGTCDSSETCSTCPLDCGSCPPGSGVLQFKSGFEANTYTTSSTIRGIDNSAPTGINNWDKIIDYLDWVIQTKTLFEGGSMQISNDPTGANNKVLHMHNKTATGGHSRSQWALKQVTGWSDDGKPNRFEQQFYRQRMFIPIEIKNTKLNRWFMLWESHVWEKENTRHGIYMRKNSGNDEWHFRVVQQRPEGNTIWENKSGQNVNVPFGQWFTLDVFFKYHETNGEFYVAVTREGKQREVTAHLKGRTKYDTKIRNNIPFKHYHHEEYIQKIPGGTHMYYDDFEIWSDYPPGY
jgi:hypothetical protein